jgi:hypothetical protein
LDERTKNIFMLIGEGIEIDSPSEFGAFVNSAVGQNLILTTGATNAPIVSLVDGTNGNINIQPHGTGTTAIKNAQLSGEVRIADLDGSNFVGFKAPDTVATNKIWTLPSTDGSNGQVLSTNGSATLSWATAGGITDLVQDTTPQLGGSLDVNGQSIVSTSNGNIVLEPNGTGDILLNADTVRVGDANAAATLTTNGTGNLTISTNSGTNSGTIAITQGTNGNIVIAPNGTGMTMLNNIEYHEKVHSLGTTSGTITPDVANGNVQTITLNGNLTLNAFTSPIAGQSLTLIVTTGGTSRTLTSTMKFAGGSKTLSTTSTTDIISVFYDGTNYWASLSKGFA